VTFRAYFALNGREFANSSRVAAHLGRDIPTDDSIFGDLGGYALVEDPPGSGQYVPGGPVGEGEDGDYPPGGLVGSGGVYLTEASSSCVLVPVPDHPGMYELPDNAVEVSPGLYQPFNGMRRVGPGMYEMGDCWGPPAMCSAVSCSTSIVYDDTWDGLQEFLGDAPYRPEIAPWYSTEMPESAEFGGVWVLDVQGLDVTPSSRQVTETVGPGGVAGPSRNGPRKITFDVLLVGCSSAGVDYGLEWLKCQLGVTEGNTTTRLRYLKSHPGHSDVDPTTLVREMNGVVLTGGPEIKSGMSTGGEKGKQANMLRVSFELTALSPFAWMPPDSFPVDWDTVVRQPINFVHAADCREPETCEDMPVLFSATCVPEEIPVINTPPPVCGGCLPVGGIDKYSFQVPTMVRPFRCRHTAVSMVVTNASDEPLTLQAFWRVCGTDVRCEDGQWPLQISGLPARTTLYLDGITRRYWAVDEEGRLREPRSIVDTPRGGPWRPPLIDRKTCWDFIVQAPPTADFSVSMTLTDRDA